MDSYEQFQEWLDEKVYESRQPMQEVYGTVFSSFVERGTSVEDAKQKAIEFVKRTFGVNHFHPLVILESVDDFFNPQSPS